MTAASELRTQVDGLLDYVTDTAIDSALGSSLPFVGDAFSSALTSGLPLLGDLKSAIDNTLDQIDKQTGAKGIASALDGLDHVEATAVGNVVKIHIGATDSFSTGDKAFGLAVGSDALGFAVSGDAALDLGYAVDVNLEYDTTTHVLSTATSASPEIALTLDGDLDVHGKGDLGFLGIDVTDKQTDPELTLQASVDIADGQAVTSLGSDDVTTRINGGASLDLGVKTDLSSDLLPTLYTDLIASYTIHDYDPTTGLDGLGGTANIALKDIELDLGSLVDFIAGVFGPIVKDVFGSFPLGPLLDVLTTPLPIIDPALHALGLTGQFDVIGDDGVINLLDIAAQFGGDKDILDAFAIAFKLINAVEAASGDGVAGAKIKLGDLTLLGDDPNAGNNAHVLGADSTDDSTFTPAPDPLHSATDALGSLLQPLVDALNSAGLSIPLLSDPKSIVPLLLNGFGNQKPVTLIQYDVPELSFTADYHQFFPIIGPIGLSFGGGLTAGIDIDFGYDTKGIETGNFADGFFLSTPELKHPINGQYYQAAGKVDIEIDAAAAVNVGVAEIAVGGGLGADLSAFFPHGDSEAGGGKLRLSDVGSGCLFDPIHGEFDANVFVKVSINFVFFNWSHRFDVADVTLAEFNFGCCSPTTDADNNGLASLMQGGLVLNVGDRAEHRVINDQAGTDIGEHYEIRNANDPDNPNSLVVTSFTIDELHTIASPVPTPIIANFGDERDVLVIGETVTASAIVNGEDGDDLLAGGAGKDTFDGGDGFDHLIGGAGDDTLNGGDDDDTLEGGLGADTIDGGDGIDQVTYEHSKAGVVFKVDANDHSVFRGHGGEAEGDTLTNVEYVIGSHYDDQIYGNPDEADTIEGLAGNDVLIGGDDDDYILGGAGADTIYGGGGENGTSYLTSSGAINVDLLGNVGHGGDAEGDKLYGIQDIQGSFADDVITGNTDDNIIDGWYGDDRLSGSQGQDLVIGGDGNDTIFGAGDNDDLDGGGSIYNKGIDLLSYERVTTGGVTVNLYEGNTDDHFGSTGDDNIARALVHAADKDVDGDKDVFAAHVSTFENLTGSKFADHLTGDDGYNVITGLAGNDEIRAMGGNDTLLGGAGADVLDGGSGIDTADYSTSTLGVTVNLLQGTGSLGDAQGDALTGIENLRGSDYADTLTGDNGDNLIDAGLSRYGQSDKVDGGIGNDTLHVDYSRMDLGRGLVGGYALGSLTDGSFTRATADGSALKDGVDFKAIERLEVVGTGQDDQVYGGIGSDSISTGEGNDVVFTGLGIDRVFAGGGNDLVVSGTDANRALSAFGGALVTELNGGSGIDTLSISLNAYAGGVVLSGTDGTGEFTGTNLVLKNGTAISDFELLAAVATGQGDDKLTQAGVHDNFFVTGFGVDEIRSGLGTDYVDGGMDYRVGREITQIAASGTLTPKTSIKSIYTNSGDLLVLDYSGVGSAVTSSVKSAATGFQIQDGNTTHAIASNSGHYAAGGNATDFVNIERLDVTGSALDDTLTGTDLLLGRNVMVDGVLLASKSNRGDDRLDGGDGNDVLLGNTGDDTLIGGNGNDLLIGAAATNRGATVDLGEVDRLTGGAGEDVFVLGSVTSSGRSIVYYSDGAPNSAGVVTAGDGSQSFSNRAIITDFGAGDHLLMAGVASDYRTEQVGRTTRIFLRDGIDDGGHADSSHDELIAEVRGAKGFQLDADHVIFVGKSVFAGPVIGPEHQPTVADPNDAGSALVAKLAALFGDDAVAPAPAAAPAPDLAHNPNAQPDPADKPANESWVTQTNDPNALRAALFDATGPLSQGKLTIEGDAASFGTFNGDPFGLGHGILLSTGQVEDLAGTNLIDGGTVMGPSSDLTFVKIGRVGDNDIFRADLSHLDFDLNSLTLGDKSSGFGGGGGIASGFDIGAVALSRTKLDSVDANTNLDNGSVLPKLSAFAFDAAHAHYTPGEQRPLDGSFPNGPDLLGEVNGLPVFDAARLDRFDTGFLTLGDGGSLGLDLTKTVSTGGPLYLYVAEAGASGETLTTGFKASSDHLATPGDLSTDLGAPGAEGDSAALTYSFMPGDAKGVPDLSLNQVTFDFVFFSEELVEFAQQPDNDTFKITLNGVNMTQLSDGSFASTNTLYTPAANGDAGSSIDLLRTDTISSDFIYNPVGTGPAAGQTRADGYSKVLHFTGFINPGETNVLKIEVNDVRDGLLDSGILIAGGSFTAHSANSFFVDAESTPVLEGQHRTIDFGLHVPNGGHLGGPLKVTLHATAGLDLGAGAGKDVVRTLKDDGTFADHVTATAVDDGKPESDRFEMVTFEFAGADAPVGGVAPLVFQVADAVARTIGDAPDTYDAAMPTAWAKAWSADGVHITHTADRTATSPAYSAVDFGKEHSELLSGSDILAGNLGVSGQARDDVGAVQEIAGAEALRFHFDSGQVDEFTFHFANFTRGDAARIDLLDTAGHLIDSVTSTSATFHLAHTGNVADIVVSAAAGAFTVHDLSFTEGPSAGATKVFAGDVFAPSGGSADTGDAFAGARLDALCGSVFPHLV